jgi:hypothetical protein
MSTVIDAEKLVVRDRRASALDEQPASAQPLATLPADLSQETVLLQVIARGAADKTVDLDRMERLLVMQERLAAKRAESDFIAAMAQFKQKAPKIQKDKRVHFTSQKGTTDYRHATLGAVCQAAIAGLADVGISHRWDLEQLQGGRITVTCILTHIGGHSTRTALTGSPDDTGNKNSIQQVSSTITYLERYTLLAATGLATDDQDDDGRAAGTKQAEQKAPAVPEGFENWWADTTAAADEGSQQLERCWAGAPKGCRAYVTKQLPREWETLKQHAAQVKA